MGRAALFGVSGTPGQIHDFSPLIDDNGLFWTMRAPDSTMHIDFGRVTGSWQMTDLPMPDAINLQNSLAGGPTTPGIVSFDVRWSPGPNQRSGQTRDPNNGFTIDFVEGGEATISWTGRTERTNFVSGTVDPSRPGTFIMLGRERNGVFLPRGSFIPAAIRSAIMIPPGAESNGAIHSGTRERRWTGSPGGVMAESVEELLARASSRVPLSLSDGKSGSVFERVEIDGESYFLKRLSRASDWIMRLTGDHIHRPYVIWQAGIMDRAPDCIDHTVVAMAVAGDGDDAVLSMLMRDVGPHLVPEGDDIVPAAQHRGFLEHLAALSAAFWGWDDPIGLTTMEQRLRWFAPDNVAAELLMDEVPGPIAAADVGWRRLPERSPLLSSMARAVHEEPELLSRPLAATPVTFLHGDWKMGNLGTHPDGRTILLDWAYPGSGPACWDLCWYLALNRARLPESKEAAIERFREALEAAGIATGGWWQAQIDLCLVGMMATIGWEKALGDGDELGWWERQVGDALRRQGLALPGVAS